MEWLKHNRTRIIMLAILALLFFAAIQGMEPKDWVITLLRGLSVGAVAFLVAAGLSLIFGLMDVLNLAHGELFMLGAYVGWTVYVRPDTIVDLATPALLLAAGLMLLPLWKLLLTRLRLAPQVARVWPWVGLAAGAVVTAVILPRYPLAIWNPGVFAESPGTYSLALSQGNFVAPAPATFAGGAPLLIMLGTLLGGVLLSLSIAGLAALRQSGLTDPRLPRGAIGGALALAALALALYWANDPITAWIFGMNSMARFLLAMAVAVSVGLTLGALIETTMIRPLYDRPIYQLMLTLGLGFIGLEVVRAIWGRPEFTMPKPDIFANSGAGCPATGIGDWLANDCATILVMGGRVRTYNEIFIIFVGLVVLVGVWLLLQRTRIGMIIRAGVQDSEMVEALGINVRRVFTFVFALGVGLATLGGVLAAPSFGLSNDMGARLLLLALIALAVGGLTSFPGAAAGAVLVGLLQQFIIKYGQIGINLPFLAEPFKPTPPLVPASTALLMVIVLLVLPQGLFGRKE